MNEKDNHVFELVKEFINSPYSLSRFCFNKNIHTTIFRNHTLPFIKKHNPELLKELEININMKENIKKFQIKEDIIKISNLMKEYPDSFGLIDVCLNTNYDILELIKECDNVLNKEDSVLFRKSIRNLKTIYFFSEKEKNNLLNSTFVFNINGELVNITKEDINIVLNFLIDNNILLCNEAFKDGCIKLYQKRLFPNKMK